jgi:hypothetical protein
MAQPEFSRISSMPGAFSRFGFGARGIGMGNAMSAITEGNLIAYYNPALASFQQKNSFQAGYTFLSLDRTLNFLSFTRKFDFYSASDSVKPRSTAGLSFGLINSGVSKIDGRDNHGFKTGDLSTSENQFFLGLANRFSDKFALGVSVKFYYYKLYEEISSTGLGFDIGAVYKFNEYFTFSLMISDLNSKYKWDTSPVYGQQGTVKEDKFPVLKKFGISYFNPEYNLLTAIEFENSNAETNFLRFGIEYNIYDRLFIRGGLDQFNLSNKDFPIKPSLGFSYSYDLNGWIAGFDYAYMLEQNSTSDRHVVGINLIF